MSTAAPATTTEAQAPAVAAPPAGTPLWRQMMRDLPGSHLLTPEEAAAILEVIARRLDQLDSRNQLIDLDKRISRWLLHEAERARSCQ